jgi:predicted Zn-dependent protease
MELKQSAKLGWVAGERWIAALDALNASGKGTAWTELGAAVAASDLKAKADSRLEALSRRSDVVGGWASYVRALYEDTKKAISLLRRAVSLAPRERVISMAYAQQLLASGDILTAQKIAKSAALRGTEDARAILAEAAFLSRKWQACRDVLAAPFLSQIASGFRP